MQIPISETLFLFESSRSHRRGGKDTPSIPSLPPGTSLAAYKLPEGFHAFTVRRQLQDASKPVQLPEPSPWLANELRLSNTCEAQHSLSHTPLGKSLLSLMSAMLCRGSSGQGTTAPTSARQPPKG